MDGEAGKGQSGTDAPFVFKDKVLVGVSGGEFGVRGWVSAYNIKDGKLAWRGFSEGPDSDTLIDPVKTTALGKPVGPNSSTSTWQGDQWKIGGGATWGWYSYDPELNLVYYGSGNPSTWNPVQRPGDNRWSMSIWARDLDTGAVKWIYQMTPHDEWDFDGVNEMILTDQTIGGTPRKLLTHFDRNGFGYTLDRTNRRIAGRGKIRSGGELGNQGRHGQVVQDLRSSAGRRRLFDAAQRRRLQLEGHLPGGARHQGRTARGL